MGMVENEMKPQVNKNIKVFERPAESLMNSFIEGKTCNDHTEIIIHKHPDFRQAGIGFISATFTFEGETSCAMYLY